MTSNEPFPTCSIKLIQLNKTTTHLIKGRNLTSNLLVQGIVNQYIPELLVSEQVNPFHLQQLTLYIQLIK